MEDGNVTVPFKRRFNFNKANWSTFAVELNKEFSEISSTPENYKHFVLSTEKIVQLWISCGYRPYYVPGLPDAQKIYTKHI